MLPNSVVSLPQICVSPAPPVEPFVEPFSPFGKSPSVSDGVEEVGVRSALLSAPPTLKHLSPLCPPDVPLKGSGLERERFELLLRASRERSMVLGSKRSPDLRKELAVKAHHSKQVERRTRFLLKFQEPPSPSAANVPKTPPESPALFHYSLPSPGLVSPFAMYEYLETECVTSKPWIEQVDFRLPAAPLSKPLENKVHAALSSRSTGKGLPSLDQISARLTMKQASGTQEPMPLGRLPSFLKQKQQPSPPQQPQRDTLTIGRLHMPGTRSRTPSPPASEVGTESIYSAPPSPKSPELQVRTTIVPKTTSSTRNLTESNLEVLSRKNMLKTLRRRSQSGHQLSAEEIQHTEERNVRRRSSPAELPKLERTDFRHPVLSLRGAF